MSKVVKIPDCANPFAVSVGGKWYRYPAGSDVEVPDEVAVVIEAHNKKHEPERFEQKAPFGSVTSWNDLTDKPTVKEGGDTLTWDGNTESTTLSAEYGIEGWHVSNAVITAEDVKNGATLVVKNGDMVHEFALTEQNFLFSEDGNFAFSCSKEITNGNSTVSHVYMFEFVPTDNYIPMEGTNYPAAGLWAMQPYPFTLTIPGYTGFATEKLDEKYLPDTIQRVGEDVILNSPSGKKFKLSVDDSGAITATEAT